MTPTEHDKELREKLDRLIIENQSEDGSIDISDQRAMRDEIMQLAIAYGERVALEAAIMGAKFGNAAFRQYSIVNPGKSVNLDDIRQSGIEQATEWARRVYES